MNVWAQLIAPIEVPPWTPQPANDGKRPKRSQFARKLNALPAIENPWDLTRAQAAVLARIAEGKTNDDISRALGIAQKTVEFHVDNIRHAMSVAEGRHVNRVLAAVLWDRFTSKEPT